RESIPDGMRRALPFVLPTPWRQPGRLEKGHQRRIARLEMARLKVALRHYQAEKGRPADDLPQLVPGSIAVIPAGPVDGRPIRYRLSQGEEIPWPPGRPGMGAPAGLGEEVRQVPAGQGILWCEGDDSIYLVPLPAK